MWLQRYSIFLKDKAEIAKIFRIVWQFGIFYILLHAVSRTPCLRAGGKRTYGKGIAGLSVCHDTLFKA